MALFTGHIERTMETELLLNVHETSLSYAPCFYLFKFQKTDVWVALMMV